MPLSFGAVAQQLELLALLDGRGLAGLGADQLQAQITLIANAYTSFFNVQAVFWGVWLLPLGRLLLRSGLVPKVLAVLVLFGGSFYVAAFIGPVFDPNYASSLAGSIIGIATGIPEVIGELGTALWLMFAGARRVQRLPAASAAG